MRLIYSSTVMLFFSKTSRKMQYILPLVLILNVLGAEDQLLLLNDDNFEHLTQAATGATTGDWLVLMYVAIFMSHVSFIQFFYFS